MIHIFLFCGSGHKRPDFMIRILPWVQMDPEPCSCWSDFTNALDRTGYRRERLLCTANVYVGGKLYWSFNYSLQGWCNNQSVHHVRTLNSCFVLPACFYVQFKQRGCYQVGWLYVHMYGCVYAAVETWIWLQVRDCCILANSAAFVLLRWSCSVWHLKRICKL